MAEKTYKNDKKENMKYWDDIEDEVRKMIIAVAKFGGVQLDDDVEDAIIKNITHAVACELEDNCGAEFPYIDQDA